MKTRADRIAILGLLAFVLACGQRGNSPASSSSGPGAAFSSAPEWVRFAIPSASFHASFPAVPEVQESMTGGFPTHTATVKHSDRIYLLSSLDLPRDRRTASTFDSFAAGAPDSVTDGMARRITSVPCGHGDTRKLTVGLLPAVEFLVTCGPTASSRVRLVDGGERIFQLIVSGSPATVSDATADRFLSSLEASN